MSSLKKLTLQIDRPCFKAILNGRQRIEHRYIYPKNAGRYVVQTDLPDGGVNVRCVHYDALYLINGRRKDAPRLSVAVRDAEFVILTDENGKEQTFTENGIEYLVCQVWYYLGDVLAEENIPAEWHETPERKAELLEAEKDIVAEENAIYAEHFAALGQPAE